MQLSLRLIYQAMKESASIRSRLTTQKLHAQLISTGLLSSIYLQNHLLTMYFHCDLVYDAYQVFANMGCQNVFTFNTMISGLANCGKIDEARKMFEEMRQRDSVSWNSIMSSYFRNGEPQETLKLFYYMIRHCECIPNSISFSCAMKACGALGYTNLGFQLHGIIQKFIFGKDISIQTSVLDMYIKCGAVGFAAQVFLRMENPSLFCYNSMIYGYSRSCGVGKALEFFNHMPERDDVSWSTMISILSQNAFGVQTLTMFVEMGNQGFRPNSMTYASALSACTRICDLGWGSHLHARIVRMETCLDIYLGGGLIDMYAKCERLDLARQVFNSLAEYNAVAWTSLIGGVAYYGLPEEAFLLFKQMRETTVAFDEFTLATLLKFCSGPDFISVGGQLHAFTIKTGMDFSVPLGNALVTMYSKCGDTQKANYAFEMMPVRDIISWTTMITAFSQIGDVEKAQACFDKMPERNVITWNSMISMYAQCGFGEQSLKLYVEMQRQRMMPDDITFATTIGACADLALLNLGTQIAGIVEKLGIGCDVSVANSIVTMYSRCGQIEEARKVFDSTSTKDLVSWNAMIAGYAQNGQGRMVIEIFENMLKMNYTPNHISYISVLSGCSHSGLVTAGKKYFEMMTRDYGMSPINEHFACMVDLLGRAGLLEEAKELIVQMPFKPNIDVWGALLNACRIHHKTNFAEFAVKNLLQSNAEESGNYVLLANIYSDSGKFEGVKDLRRLMKEKRIQKNPGCSWIEVNNRVHAFTVDETDHPQINHIHAMLEEISKKIEDKGSSFNAISSDGSWSCSAEKLAMVLC